MPRCLKPLILDALRVPPSFCGLRQLQPSDSNEGRALLKWMDRSGLALYFWQQLRACDATDVIPSSWRHALQQRYIDNVARTDDMLGEFRRVISSFERHGIKAVVLKGFSLAPTFCEDVALRHQADFDFLVEPKNVKEAARALEAYGYQTPHLNDSSETSFATPMQRVPSTEDYLYAPQHQRQLDLHVSLWEPSPWIDFETPKDIMTFTERRAVHGVEFWSLSLADNFLSQVLHVFRHTFRSWVRLSWLFELARCMSLHKTDAGFWYRVIQRAGEATITRKAFALVLGLVNRLFDVQSPAPLARWLERVENPGLQAWLAHFGFDWAVAEWPGSLSNLFVTREFIPESNLRAQYWLSRLLPRTANASIGTIAAEDARTLAKLQLTRVTYLVQRAIPHIKDICGLPVQGLRWKRALEAARHNAVAMNS